MSTVNPISPRAADLREAGPLKFFALLLAVPTLLCVPDRTLGQQLQYNVIDIGGDPQSAFSSGYSINNSGAAVGNVHGHAFLYTNGPAVDINTLVPASGWVLSVATGINDQGQIIGTGTYNAQPAAFIYTPNTVGKPELGGTITTLGDSTTMPYNINNQGEIVGVTGSGQAGYGFLFSAGVMLQALNLFPNPGGWRVAVPTSINDLGQIAGFGSSDPLLFSSTGFLYTQSDRSNPAGGGTIITLLNGYRGSSAFSLNNSGHVVGALSDSSGHNHAFLYDGSSFTLLAETLGEIDGCFGFLGNSYGYSINDQDQVLGQRDCGQFVYSNGNSQYLENLQGTNPQWIFSFPVNLGNIIAGRINNSAQIATQAALLKFDGTFHPVVLTPSAVCRVSLNHVWKQADAPWGITSYDESYRTISYPTTNSTPISPDGRLQLMNGAISYSIDLAPLSAIPNNLSGLATALQSIPGVNATGPWPRDSTGPYYLSVYNTRCLAQDCFPRDANTLQLLSNTTLNPTEILSPKLMSQMGCYLTSFAMALSYAGVSNINAAPLYPQLDPGSLNDFMSNNLFGLPSLGGLFANTGIVDPSNTARFVGLNTGNYSLKFQTYGGTVDSTKDLADADAKLDQAVCTDKVPFIVGVTSPKTRNYPGHFVLVVGKNGSATDGSNYLISDPAFGNTTLKDYNNKFQTRGAVTDPSGDMSELDFSVDDNADVIVTDSSGAETGWDSGSNQILQGINGSAYFRDQVDDDLTGDTTAGLSHFIQIPTPVGGTYNIAVVGQKPGFYTLSIHSYAQDGTLQGNTQVPGIAANGSVAEYALQLGTTAPQLVLLATFGATIADISNGLKIGMIDNSGIANSLMTKMQAAQNATGPARRLILNAFIKEVNAQSGKHIVANVAQILIKDANSLIAQNQ